MIQKQFAPVFLAIPSQYSLKCLVISLWLEVSSWDNGLVVHALEIAINLLPNRFFLHFKEPIKCFISLGIFMFWLCIKS